MNPSPGRAENSATPELFAHRVSSPRGWQLAWRFGRREILAALIGVLIFIVLSDLVVLLAFSTPGSTGNILWFLPVLVVPLFVGVVYGPWTGLISGGLGYFLSILVLPALPLTTKQSVVWVNGVIATVRLADFPFTWHFAVALCSLGLVAGFARFFTRGPDPFFRRLYTAELFSILAILLAFFIAFNAFWPRLYLYETVWLDFTHIALPNIMLVLFLLPMLLMVHQAIGKIWDRNRSSASM